MNYNRYFLFVISLFILFSFTSSTHNTQHQWAIAIHGGAGNFKVENISLENQILYTEKLEQALRSGAKTLMNGGSSLDAVEKAISIMEDSPLFNAGKGSVLTHEGKVEMDASIMDGKSLNAGAVAGVKQIRNPIKGARLVMEQSNHVMLSGAGADQFGSEHGLATEHPDYFIIEKRKLQLQRQLNKSGKMGTVGCVALDKQGNIAAGTSTGGMTNKAYGRIGDSPIIGCGCYANNATCGISFTGHGEYIIRHVAAHDISAIMEYSGHSLEEAMNQVVNKKLKNDGGNAGAIGIDSDGNISVIFNTSGMFHAYCKDTSMISIALN